MKRIVAGAIASLLSTCIQADNGQEYGLCNIQEIVYFSCQSANKKWINLCGEPKKALQYRFGKKGHMEFIYPQNADEGERLLSFAHYFRFQTELTEVSFDNKGFNYAIFDYLENGTRRSGVRITSNDGRDREVVCAVHIVSRLAYLQGLLRCDRDNALNGGICP